MTTKSNTSFPLIGLMLRAPLAAVSETGGDTIHAVTMEAIAMLFGDEIPKQTTVDSACGEPVKILSFGDGVVGVWPPRARGSKLTRCKRCYELTGKPRLRKEQI